MWATSYFALATALSCLLPSAHAQVRVPSRSAPAAVSENVVRHQAGVYVQHAAELRRIQASKTLSEAARLFEKGARLFESSGSPDQAADAYFQAGEIYFTFGRYEVARQFYRHSQETGRNPELRCRSLSRLARTYATTGPLPLAERYSKAALELCASEGKQGQAEAMEARGEALDSAGEHSSSEDYFRRALSLFVESHDDEGAARTQLMLAYAAFFSDAGYQQGLESASRALQLWNSLGNIYGVARARSALGIFAATRGEFETAQCNYRQALPLFHQVGDKDNEAIVLNGLGFVNRETGNWQQSLEYYATARAAFTQVRDLLGEHEAITGMGKAFSALGSYHRLLPIYEEGLAVAHQARDSVLMASSLADAADAYAASHHYRQAESFYRRSLFAYRAPHNLYGEGDVLLRWGHLQARQGRYAPAIASLERANQLKEKTGQIDDIARIQYELAWIYRRLNRLDEARARIEKTIDIVEDQRVTISKFDSRAAYFASVHKYYGLYIQILMLLHQAHPTGGFAVKAFNASERSKVRSLLDLLTTSAQDAPCEELLQRQLQPEDTGGYAKTSPASPATLTLDKVQELIQADNTVVIEFALGDEKSYAWVIDQDQMLVHELPGADRLRKLAANFRAIMNPPALKSGESASDYQANVARAMAQYETYSRGLSDLLLAPIVSIQSKRILIVPDGPLQYIPFSALPFPAKVGTHGRLVDHFEVDMLPSASVLGVLRQSIGAKNQPSAVAAIFADPVYEPDDPRVSVPGHSVAAVATKRPHSNNRAMLSTSGLRYVPRLLASRSEAQAVANVLGSPDTKGVHLALDFDANRKSLLEDGLGRFRIIHFATHGILNSRQPEMSGLVLSLVDRNGRRQNGYLRLGDIYKLKLSADLVVLSSCDSALGKELDSEGIIGLPRGFLYAGAKSVIASLWKVDDESTAKLMTSLYTRIGRGESPSAALRGAQLEMMRDKRWSKPYYWAAFALQGDYR